MEGGVSHVENIAPTQSLPATRPTRLIVLRSSDSPGEAKTLILMWKVHEF